MSITTAARSPLSHPWAVAAVVGTVALAASIGIVLGSFLINGRGGAEIGAAAGYVPAGAVTYVEASLDLPDDQRAALQELLGRFEGIDVDDVIGAGLGEKLDQLLTESGVDHSYSEEIAPWFDGRVAFALLDADYISPTNALNPLGGMGMQSLGSVPNMLALVGTRDAAATTAFLDELRGEAEAAGATSSSESYAGATIWSIDAVASLDELGTTSTPSGGAYALSGDHLLMGPTAETIKTALDVHAGTSDSFASRADVQAAVDGLPSERVATFVSDSAPVVESMRAALSELMPELDAVADVYASGLSMLQVGSLRFEGDRVVADGVGTMPSRGMANSDRSLAEAVPADALAYVDGTGIGSYLADLIAAGKEAAAAAGEEDAVAQVEGILGAKIEEFVAWIDEAALTGGWDGTAPWGGLLITPTSTEEAELRLGQLRALAGLAGMGGIGLTVTDEEVDGVTVTRFAVSEMGTDVAFEYAITDGRVLIGFGDSFIRRVLETDAAASLAASDRFAAALDEVGGASGTSLLWADIDGLRQAIEEGLPAEERGEYDEKVAPWLESLDTLIGVMRVEGDSVISQGALIAK